MTVKLNKLQRNRHFNTDLNIQLDAILDRLNVLSGTAPSAAAGTGKTPTPALTSTTSTSTSTSTPGGTTPAVTTPNMVNTSSRSFSSGQVMGFDKQKPALAVSSQFNTVRALAVVTNNSRPGQDLPVAYIGRVKVLVDYGISPAPGDPVYLSAKTAGMVTNTVPAPPALNQLLGMFDSTLDRGDGKCWLAFIPSLILGGSI